MIHQIWCWVLSSVAASKRSKGVRGVRGVRGISGMVGGVAQIKPE